MKAMKFWLLMAVMVVAIAAHARKNDDPRNASCSPHYDGWQTDRGLHS